jgi:hypothetical protein
VTIVHFSWTNGPRILAALALAGALAFAALGCGDTIIDSGKAEDTIKASLEKSRHEEIDAVDCPSHQKVEAGAIFTCLVQFSDGQQETATLKIRNSDADLDVVGLKANK